jgi:pyridoxine 5-phosphate synthase
MIRLGVNIDHVATLRQARRAKEPDPVAAAVLAQLGGADGITIHLREDRRHIQDRDVRLLRQTVTRILNLEMAVADEIVAIACEVKPDQVTLVPERRQELTTEGGLDVVGNRRSVTAAIAKLAEHDIPVSMFIAADKKQIDASQEVGAVAIELHTGAYADAPTAEVRRRHLHGLRDAAEHARQLGLHVHMGHGLDTINVVDIARIPGVEELNIGFSIVARAVFLGLEQAVREMKETIHRAVDR